jgi:peptidoglycan/LPS O-acetylase OafA/YrhL
VSPIAYRAEIDGLRAIAVLAVTLYHFGITSMSGGFVGVDVFFVISGYLITAILQRQFAANQFSIADFYRRRALRILPALLFLLAVLCVLMPIAFTPVDIKAFARSLPPVAAFLSNFYFGKEFNYFDAASDTQMLLHTWSLAVEEQFYILYPIMLGLAFRYARRFMAALVWISVLLSFALSVYLLETNQAKIAFYMFPPRAWELGLGAVIALGATPTVANRMAREVLSAGGVALIAFGVFSLTAASSFPGVNALAPCLGAALIIAYGSGTRLGAVLGSRLPRGIGKISYSLYLWHWPVAVVARQFMGAELGLSGLAICLVVSVALAVASYRWIETPFRARTWTQVPVRKLLAGALASLLIAAAAGPALAHMASASLLLRQPQAKSDLAYLDYDRRPESRVEVSRDVCFLTEESPNPELNVQTCLTDRADRPNVLTFGDSHLAYLLPGLREAYPATNFVQATAAGCSPIDDYALGKPYCRPMIDMIYDRLGKHRYQAVILGARWAERDVPSLVASIGRLKASGQTVIVMGPALEYSDALPAVLARMSWIGTGFSTEPFLREDRRELDRIMRDAVTRAGATYVSEQTPLCSENRCEARAPSGAPIVFDYAHYTTDGARRLAARIREDNPGLADVIGPGN